MSKCKVRWGGRAVKRSWGEGSVSSDSTRFMLGKLADQGPCLLSLLQKRSTCHLRGSDTGGIPAPCCSLFQVWKTAGGGLATSSCQLSPTRGLWKPIKIFTFPFQVARVQRGSFIRNNDYGVIVLCFVVLFCYLRTDPSPILIIWKHLLRAHLSGSMLLFLKCSPQFKGLVLASLKKKKKKKGKSQKG